MQAVKNELKRLDGSGHPQHVTFTKEADLQAF